MSPDEQLLLGFFEEVDRVLPALVDRNFERRQSSLLASPDRFAGELAVAVRCLRRTNNTLTIVEKAEVATFFLPLLRRISASPRPPKIAPTLVFTAPLYVGLNQKVPLFVRVQLNDAALLKVEIRRAGQLIYSSAQASFTYDDLRPVPAAGVEYQAEAIFSNTTPLKQKRMVHLSQGLRATMGLTTLGDEALSELLTQVAPTPISEEAQALTFNSAKLANMLVWIPLTSGALVEITNEQFGTANLLPTFLPRPLVVDKVKGVLWASVNSILPPTQIGYTLKFKILANG